MSGNKERNILVQVGPLDRQLYRCRFCGCNDWVYVSYSRGSDITMIVHKCAECNKYKVNYYNTSDLEEIDYFADKE